MEEPVAIGSHLRSRRLTAKLDASREARIGIHCISSIPPFMGPTSSAARAPRGPGMPKSNRDKVHEVHGVLGPTVQGESQTPQRDQSIY
jgi:hypothetical protein